jgi:hypothetical protein
MFSTGSYSFGAEGTASIHFIVGDTAITIYGHASETALEDLARSVLDRMPSPTRSTLSGASRLIGAPIVLPDTNIVGQADAASIVTTLCPSSGDSACQATVEFPSLDVSYVPLTIRYLRPAPVDPDTSYGSVVKQVHGSAIVSLDGVSALYVPGTPGAQPSWIEFVSNGSDVTIQGIYDEATLASLARSVVDSSK